MNEQSYYSAYPAQQTGSLSIYTAKTFLWMFLGLMTTFGVALFSLVSGITRTVAVNQAAIIVLTILELAVVLGLSFRIQKISVAGAFALFFAYAILNGVVFSVYFLIFNLVELVFAVAATSLFFLITAVLGFVTKADLTRLRTFFMCSLIFMIVFWLLSMFINLSAFTTAVTCFGVFVFLAMTAYDTQKIKSYYYAFGNDSAMASKASIIAALNLYLDYINLLIHLLRLLGKKK